MNVEWVTMTAYNKDHYKLSVYSVQGIRLSTWYELLHLIFTNGLRNQCDGAHREGQSS